MALDANYWNLADRLMQYIYRETKLPMIVCNEQGVITKAIDPSRIGVAHDGAKQILSGQVDECAITAEEAALNSHVKEGYSYPIKDGGCMIGTFGVTGSLVVTRPVAKVAAMVLASWAKEAQQQSMLHEVSEHIARQADAMGRQIDSAATKAAGVEKTISTTVSKGIAKVNATDSIINKIRQISQQSHILSINGSVEASRAGDHGRAFAVVAEQMTELATATRAAAADILNTLEEIRSVIGTIHEAGNQAADGSHEQIDLMTNLITEVDGLQQSISAIENQFSHKLN